MTTTSCRFKPPSGAERMLRSSLIRAEREAVLGDLHEEFVAIAKHAGERAARTWYWRQATRSILPNALRRLRNDERRMSEFKTGLRCLALGLLNTLLDHRRLDAAVESWLFDALLMLTGTLGVGRALFAQRARMFKAQVRALTCMGGVAIVGVAIIDWVSPMGLDAWSALVWVYIFVAAFAAVSLWPSWPKDPAAPLPNEFAVRRKASSDDERRRWMTVAVPNVPLGMSGLVLSAAGGASDPSPPIRLGALTLRRRFTNAETVRIYAALNDVDATAHASLDVIDTTGQVVRALRVDVATSGLERVIKSSDDDEEDDAPSQQQIGRFSEIDVRLPLADLSPGPYRVRLTAHDGGQSSVQQDGFVVTPI